MSYIIIDDKNKEKYNEEFIADAERHNWVFEWFDYTHLTRNIKLKTDVRENGYWLYSIKNTDIFSDTYPNDKVLDKKIDGLFEI